MASMSPPPPNRQPVRRKISKQYSKGGDTSSGPARNTAHVSSNSPSILPSVISHPTRRGNTRSLPPDRACRRIAISATSPSRSFESHNRLLVLFSASGGAGFVAVGLGQVHEVHRLVTLEQIGVVPGMLAEVEKKKGEVRESSRGREITPIVQRNDPSFDGSRVLRVRESSRIFPVRVFLSHQAHRK